MFLVHTRILYTIIFYYLKKNPIISYLIELVYSDTFFVGTYSVENDNFIMFTMDNLKYIISISQCHNYSQSK